MYRKIILNAVSLTITQIIVYSAQFFVLVHLLSVFDLDVYGLVAFSQAFIAASIMLLDLGFSVSATNKISSHRGSVKYVGKVISSILMLKFVAIIIGALIIQIFFASNDSYIRYQEILLFSMPMIVVSTFTPVWYFYGVEKVHGYSVFFVIGKLLFSTLVALFVTEPDDYIYVPLYAVLGQLLVLLYSFHRIKKAGIKLDLFQNKIFIKYTLSFTKAFFVSRLAIAFNTSGAVLMLGSVVSPAAVAVYSLADQIYRVLQTLVGSVCVPLYAHMSKNGDVSLMIKIILLFAMLLIVFGGGGYFMIPFILEIIGFDGGPGLIPLLGAFLVIFIINSINTLMGYPLYASVGRLEVVNATLIIGGLAYLILLTCLHTFGQTDLMLYAMALLMSEFYILLHRTISISKILNFKIR